MNNANELKENELNEVTGGKNLEPLPKDYYENVMMTNPVSGISEEECKNGN